MSAIVESEVPARLDRLSWSRFHTLVVLALGITWVLDGLEVTLAGAVSGALKASPALHLSDTQVGFVASAYLAGAVGGAFLFGWLTDRFGRRKLFFVTLGTYLVATALTALSPNLAWLLVFRFFTGAGIGGEYSAINSAIQELTPARYRGRTDIIINGSFWLGAALGAAGSALLLAPGRFAPDFGWRLAFGIGAVLGVGIIFLRRLVPESPRWLMIHGREKDADAKVREIEARAGEVEQNGALKKTRLRPRQGAIGLADLARSLFKTYPRRAVVALTLMSAQAFFYNALFFTYPLVLGRFFKVPEHQIGWYLLPFAAASFCGPLLLGRLFDTIGRKRMIAATFALSGVLLAGPAGLFLSGTQNALAQTAAWAGVFFIASAAASSAYLTVGESFPLEVRALAIALFYALGTAVGGIAGPALFGALIDSGARGNVFLGYAFGALLMLAAAFIEWRYGEAAERRSLEDVAAPIAAAA